KKVNSLKRQTQKANRYQKLSTQLKFEEVRLGAYEYEQFNTKIGPLSEKLQNLELVAEQYLGEINKKEADVEEMNAVLIGREQKLREAQLALEEIDKKVKTIEEEVLVSRERKSNLEDLIRRYSEENATLAQRKDILASRIDELTQSVQAAEATYASLHQDLESQKTDYHAFEESLNGQKNQLENYRKELVQLIDETAKKRNSYQLTKNNIQNLERKIAELEKDIEIQQTDSGDTLTLLDEQNYSSKQMTAKIEQLRSDVEQHQKMMENHRNTLDQLRSRKAEAEAEIKSVNARIAIVQKAIENHEGFPGSVQFLLNEKTLGLDNTVADILSTEDRFKKALEAALGESFSFLIGNSVAGVRDALMKLSSSDHGYATFLNREKLPAGETARTSLDKSQIIALATEVVHSKDTALVQLLIGDVAFVDNFDKATALAEQFPAYRFVTLNGEIVKGNYLIKGSGKRKATGSVIGQRETLQQLLSQTQQLEKELSTIQQQIIETEQALQTGSTQANTLQSALRNAEQELIQLEKSISQFEYEQKRTRENVTKNQDSISQARQEKELFQATLDEIDPTIHELEQRRTTLEVKTRELEFQLNELEKQRREKFDALNHVQSTALRLEGELHNHRSGIDNAKQQILQNDETIARHSSESAAAQAEIERINETATSHDIALTELLQTRDKSEKNRDYENQEVAKLRENAAKIDTDLKRTRRQRDELINSRHSLEQDHTQLKFEIRNLCERIQREYDFDLTKDSFENLETSAVTDDETEMEETPAEIVAQPQAAFESVQEEKSIDDVLDDDLPAESQPAAFDPLATKTLIDDIRRKIKMLGPVNMEAFAEFTVEKERLDLLVQQRQDLLDAEHQLLQTIETINTTAQKQFMEVFEKIRENFIKIFTSLFDASEANLELAKNEDPLEANIDILARPTGKKIQHIALLSGGEKTLTAISLLFAIYLVKPSPFCILDEVDAPLDDTNIDKFTKLLRDFSKDTQFIVVTHNKRTMEAAANIFGITMQEAGVSKVVSVKFSNRGEDTDTDDIEELIRRNQVEELNQEIKDPPSAPANN
ncbi:chromosome segregation protein SMC, partial [bacterium]|nr:chromosome segregation protein SMC [bacterium]